MTVWTRYCIKQCRYNRVRLYFSNDRTKFITWAEHVEQKGESITKFEVGGYYKNNLKEVYERMDQINDNDLYPVSYTYV